MAGAAGFSVLLWTKPESPMLTTICLPNQTATIEAKQTVERQLLTEAAILLSVRWSFDVKVQLYNDTYYAFGVNPRFTVGNNTLRNALGELTEHIEFMKAGTSATFEDLCLFQECKRKWRVPDNVTESTSGWEQQEPGQTSRGSKRARFS